MEGSRRIGSGARRRPITAVVRAAIAADARAFLCERYGLADGQAEALAEVPVVWVRRGSGRAHWRNGPGEGAVRPHIRLTVPAGATTRFHLYRRRTAGLTTPQGGIEMPVRLMLTLTLVHEYTHALQYGAVPGVRVARGEVEPTRNEIRYLALQVPDAYDQLVAVPPRPKRRGTGRRAAAAAEPLPGGRRRPGPVRSIVARLLARFVR